MRSRSAVHAPSRTPTRDRIEPGRGEAAVVDRLHRRHQAELIAPRPTAALPWRQPLVETAVRHLCGDPAAKPVRREHCHLAHTAGALEEVGPVFIAGDAQGSHQADAGDGDAAGRHDCGSAAACGQSVDRSGIAASVSTAAATTCRSRDLPIAATTSGRNCAGSRQGDERGAADAVPAMADRAARSRRRLRCSGQPRRRCRPRPWSPFRGVRQAGRAQR